MSNIEHGDNDWDWYIGYGVPIAALLILMWILYFVL